VITIPATALRRSWLLERLEGVHQGIKLRRELALLNRTAAAKQDILDPRRCLQALVREAASRFPVSEPYFIWEMFDDQAEPNAWLDAIRHGIPCDVQGYHPEDGNHVADLAALDVSSWVESPDDLRNLWEEKEYAALKRWWPGPLTEAQVKVAGKIPPAGRIWRGPWVGLPDLVDFVRGDTMNGWLDMNFEDADGAEMPEWTADEIRSMERGWKDAKPILARIDGLTKFISDDLPARLPMLDRALRGDAQTLAQITRPHEGQTLAQIFGKKRPQKGARNQ
jgi:hypothetical protein